MSAVAADTVAALCKLTLTAGDADELMAAGCDSIIDALKLHASTFRSDRRVVSGACRALSGAVRSEHCRLVVLKGGFVSDVAAQALLCHWNDPDCLSAAVELVAALSAYPGGFSDEAIAEICQVALCLLQRDTKACEPLLTIGGLLKVLCPRLQLRLAPCFRVGWFGAALQRRLTHRDTALASCLCESISLAAAAPGNGSVLVEAGVLSALSAALKAHSDDESVASNACAAISQCLQRKSAGASKALTDAGTMEAVLQALRRHGEASSRVASCACRAIRAIADAAIRCGALYPGPLPRAAAAGASAAAATAGNCDDDLGRITQVLRRHGDDTAAAASAVSAMEGLTHDEGGGFFVAEALVRAGAAQLITVALRRHCSGSRSLSALSESSAYYMPSIASPALSTLINLAKREFDDVAVGHARAGRIVAAGAIEAANHCLAEAMRRECTSRPAPADEVGRIVSHGVSDLLSAPPLIASTVARFFSTLLPVGGIEFFSCGAHATLVAAIHTFSSDLEFIRSACTVISRATLPGTAVRGAASLFAAVGAVDAVVRAVRFLASRKVEANFALTAARGLALDTDVARELSGAGGAAAVVLGLHAQLVSCKDSLAAGFPGNVQCIGGGSFALLELAAVDPRATMAAKSLLPLLVSLMRRSDELSTDCKVACGIVRNLAVVPEHRRQLKASGCAEAVVACMRMNQDCVEVAASGCSALFALVCDPAVASALAKAGIAGVIAFVMKKHRRCKDVRLPWAICGIFFKLAEAANAAGDTAALEALLAAGAGTALKLALQQETADPRVVAAACGAIALLASSSKNVEALGKLDLAPRIAALKAQLKSSGSMTPLAADEIGKAMVALRKDGPQVLANAPTGAAAVLANMLSSGGLGGGLLNMGYVTMEMVDGKPKLVTKTLI